MRWILMKFLRVFCLIAVVLLAVLVIFRLKYNKAIRELAQTQVINSTSDLINDAIDKQIETGNVHYDRIVYFEKDLNGRITALKTNMSEVNRLKTDTVFVHSNSLKTTLIQMVLFRVGFCSRWLTLHLQLQQTAQIVLWLL